MLTTQLRLNCSLELSEITCRQSSYFVGGSTTVYHIVDTQFFPSLAPFYFRLLSQVSNSQAYLVL